MALQLAQLKLRQVQKHRVLCFWSSARNTWGLQEKPMEVINGTVVLEDDAYQELLEFAGTAQMPPMQAELFIPWLQQVLEQRRTGDQLMKATFLSASLVQLEESTNYPSPRGNEIFRQCAEDFERYLEKHDIQGPFDEHPKDSAPPLH